MCTANEERAETMEAPVWRTRLFNWLALATLVAVGIV
jgi:hypothetical protein